MTGGIVEFGCWLGLRGVLPTTFCILPGCRPLGGVLRLGWCPLLCGSVVGVAMCCSTM